MERLVVDLEKFNLQQSNKLENAENRTPLTDNKINLYKPKFVVNNCFPNMNIRCDEIMPEKKSKPLLQSAHDEDDEETSSVSSTSEAEDSDGGGDNADSETETIDKTDSQSQSSAQNHQVRKMPERANKRNLYSSNLRTSMKPQKFKSKCPGTLRPAEIKKIYTNKKLTKFRPTSLETIFEEPQPMRGSEQYRLIGAKKLRRSLVCKNGQNVNKAVVKQRRARIKKNLGARTTWKKIPLQNFLDYMQGTLNSENEDEELPSDKGKTTLTSLNESNEIEMKATEELQTSKTENITQTKVVSSSFTESAVKVGKLD